jgi:hypothetical protein
MVLIKLGSLRLSWELVHVDSLLVPVPEPELECIFWYLFFE